MRVWDWWRLIYLSYGRESARSAKYVSSSISGMLLLSTNDPPSSQGRENQQKSTYSALQEGCF